MGYLEVILTDFGTGIKFWERELFEQESKGLPVVPQTEFRNYRFLMNLL